MILKGLKHGSKISRDLDISNGSLAIPKPTSAPPSGPDAVSVLEAKVNGQ